MSGFPVDRTALAEALTFWITDGVVRDAVGGGPLSSLMTHVNFGRLFEMNDRLLGSLTRLETVVGRIDETLALLHSLDRRAASAGRPAAGGEFSALVTERARGFVGRRHVIAEIDAALSAPDFSSGYVFITGEPGIGKTSLLAHLVSVRGLPHYFNSRSEGTTSPAEFFAKTAAQLAERYGVFVPDSWEASSGGALFSRLLSEAAARATAERPLVLAIDALDEADSPPPGANRLFLPRSLPEHTYIIVTSRELNDPSLAVDRRRDVHIADDSPENLGDIAEYIRGRTEGPHARELAVRMAAWGMTSARFEDFLVTKSQGNFLYVFHIVEDISRHRLTPEALSDPRKLPNGLRDYYKVHWQVMKERWPPSLADRYETALRCLAVMREPVPLGAWTDLAPDVDDAVARHVVGEWREFLNTRWSDDHDEPVYAVYHSTFVDFLRVEGPGLEPYERMVYRIERSLLLDLLGERPATGDRPG
ncbi:ATP-binding protein [Actinocorallia populi]|uniref:ATP-binding protein n=1 Tax=Actinocorallia populi TaxID=2079200 RepID=UPI0013004E5B|nr:ATP-binding protein [Actinocorallia populi]